MSFGSLVDPRRSRRRALVNRGFIVLCIACCLLSVATLTTLLTSIFWTGFSRIDGIDWPALRGESITLPALDGTLVRIAPDELEVVDELLNVRLASGEEFTIRRSALSGSDGVLRGEDSFWGPVEFTDKEINWRDAILRASSSEVSAPEVRQSELQKRAGGGLAARIARETELGRFLTSPPSRNADEAGFMPAMTGSMVICLVCAASALPLGIGTAVFLEEFKPRRRWARIVHSFSEMNIRNLSGVPSIVYGIIGLTAFVTLFGLGNPREPFFAAGDKDSWLYLQLPFGRAAIAGGLTLMLVVLPIIIISSQEALRAVPNSLREGALAMGATRWQMVWNMTLPTAIPGIMTGAILAMSRAIGEAAPILVIAGIVYITWAPKNLMDEFTAMPLQIYNWASRPQEDFHSVAAAGIIVLLVVLLTFNAAAVLIRQKFQKSLH